MPARVWMNVRYHTTHDQYVPVAARWDHRIAVHPEAKRAVLFAWLRTQTDAKSRAEADRLAPQLARYWLDEADRRRRDGRLLATIGALREALKADPDPASAQRLHEAVARQAEFDRLVNAGNAVGSDQPGEAIPILQKILALKPDYAPARGELGTMYALLGDHAAAGAELRAAAASDPDDSDRVTALAAPKYREGRWEEAAELFAKADEIEPYNANTHHGWGFALLNRMLGRRRGPFPALDHRPQARRRGRRPERNARRQGQVEEAVLQARQAVRWNCAKNAKMLLTLADGYAAAGGPADARKTLGMSPRRRRGRTPTSCRRFVRDLARCGRKEIKLLGVEKGPSHAVEPIREGLRLHLRPRQHLDLVRGLRHDRLVNLSDRAVGEGDAAAHRHQHFLLAADDQRQVEAEPRRQ